MVEDKVKNKASKKDKNGDNLPLTQIIRPEIGGKVLIGGKKRISLNLQFLHTPIVVITPF